MVARVVRDDEVVSSNLTTPTTKKRLKANSLKSHKLKLDIYNSHIFSSNQILKI